MGEQSLKGVSSGREWIFSTDDHVVEPPHVWQDRLPAKYREAGPKVIRDDQGEAWVFEDIRIPGSGLGASAGRGIEGMSRDPISFAEMRPGCYEPKARVDDMTLDGVIASVCFPSMFPRFCGQAFSEAKDKDLGFLCIQAYNDWMIDEWCGAAPGRLVPLTIMPLWDPQLAATEIERCAAKGSRAVCFSENPEKLGFPSLFDPANYWDPVIDAAAEAGLVLAVHVGSSSAIPKSSPDAPWMSAAVWGSSAIVASTLVDWIFSGKLQKYPKTKIELAEGGIGWIPYYLERAKREHERHRHWQSREDAAHVEGVVRHAPSGEFHWDLDPHALFREHFYGCVIADAEPFGLSVVDQIGVGNVMVETDFPHSDMSWPDSFETVSEFRSGLDPGDRYEIMQGNARRLFKFEPVEPQLKSDSHF